MLRKSWEYWLNSPTIESQLRNSDLLVSITGLRPTALQSAKNFSPLLPFWLPLPGRSLCTFEELRRKLYASFRIPVFETCIRYLSTSYQQDWTATTATSFVFIFPSYDDDDAEKDHIAAGSNRENKAPEELFPLKQQQKKRNVLEVQCDMGQKFLLVGRCLVLVPVVRRGACAVGCWWWPGFGLYQVQKWHFEQCNVANSTKQ